MAALTINSQNVLRSGSGQFFIGTAGANITAGQPVYLDTVTSTYKLANAVGASPLNVVAGIAVASANTNQDLSICSRDPNFSPGYPINAGNMAILGNVAGQVNDVADRATGWYVTLFGVGLGNNRIKLSIVGSNVSM